MTRVADTSFLLMLFDESDPRRERALAWGRESEPIEVPSEVLSETLGVAHRRFGFPVAWKIWHSLEALPHVQFAPSMPAETVAKTFYAGKGHLSWVDAVVVTRCRFSGATPLCFDPGITKALKGPHE